MGPSRGSYGGAFSARLDANYSGRTDPLVGLLGPPKTEKRAGRMLQPGPPSVLVLPECTLRIGECAARERLVAFG